MLLLSMLRGFVASSSVVALFVAQSGHVFAQPRDLSRVPTDAHAYQAYQIQQQYWNQRARQAASRPVAASRVAPAYQIRQDVPQVTVAVTTPESQPVMVDIRGADGTVRSFPVVGGAQAITVRQIALRPGEKVTLNLPAPK